MKRVSGQLLLRVNVLTERLHDATKPKYSAVVELIEEELVTTADVGDPEDEMAWHADEVGHHTFSATGREFTLPLSPSNFEALSTGDVLRYKFDETLDGGQMEIV